MTMSDLKNDKSIEKEIGQKLKQLRESKNKTLREVGESLDIDYTYLSRIERGYMPSMKLLKALAEYYETDLPSLFGEEVPLVDQVKEVGVEWISFSKEMKEKNLSPEDIKEILGVVGKYSRFLSE